MRRLRLDAGGACIAQAVVFTDGAVAVRMLGDRGKTPRTTSYSSLEDALEDLGATARWEDKCCFACGAAAERASGPGGCVSCGATWCEPVDAADPKAGRWRPSVRVEAHVP